MADLGVVLGYLALGRTDGGVDHPVWVGQAQVAQGFWRALALGHGLAGHGALQVDGGGRFVISQAMEYRVAHHTVAGHLGVGHFGQQGRLEPMHTPRFCTGRWLAQGWFGRLQRLEPRMNAAQGGRAEAGAHLAGIAQRAALVVHGQ
ncbi:hypothetical protein D3C80_1200990 [compost metagenome]